MRPRKTKHPIIDGLPSPSAAKMARMTVAELEEHINKLNAESGHLTKRIERLEAKQPPDTESLNLLRAQDARLQVLLELAKQKLTDKREGRDRPISQGSRPYRSGGRPYGGSGGGGRGYGGGSGGSGGGSTGYGSGPSRGRPRW